MAASKRKTYWEAVRDNQRSAVYRWENATADALGWKTKMDGAIRADNGRDGFLTIPECEAIVRTVWADYGLQRPPCIKDGRGRRKASGGRDSLALPRWARIDWIVLHELAHALCDAKIREPHAPHGRRFASLLTELWVRYLGVERKVVRDIGRQQRPRRVHFAPLRSIPKPVRRPRPTAWPRRES